MEGGRENKTGRKTRKEKERKRRYPHDPNHPKSPPPPIAPCRGADAFDGAADEAGEESGVQGEIRKFRVEDGERADRCQSQSFNRNRRENCISALIAPQGVSAAVHPVISVARRPDLRTSANKSAVISEAGCVSFRDYGSSRIQSAL